MSPSHYKVIIIGAGFGGLNAAKELGSANLDLLVLDRTNHHLFQPLLYQVATAALSPGNIANPIRQILKNQKNTTVYLKEISQIKKEEKVVVASDKSVFHYDYLIVATGAHHDYFGHNEWEQFAPGLKTLPDALLLRNKILQAFENAESCSHPEQLSTYLRFVIVGGGPTGVELAGAIADIATRSLFENFRNIKPEDAEILLIEGENQILPGYPAKLGDYAKKSLEVLGIKVLLNTRVTQIDQLGVYVGDKLIPSATVIWSAGNRASALLQTLDVPLSKHGNVIVNPDLSIPGHPEIFVIGDAAHALDRDGKPLPGIAPVAIQQGQYVADIIKTGHSVSNRKPFIYKDKGMMATIGNGKAIGVMKKMQISGFPAWLAWGLIHIYYLIGFANRTLVLLQWFLLYIGKRNVRLILKKIPKKSD